MNIKVKSELKKLKSGNIEILFTIPASLIATTKLEVVKKMANDMIIPGFRKGMAPLAKAEENINPDTLSEHILSHILPKAFSDSVTEYKFNPAIYPKFTAMKIGQGSDWEIKAVTCELAKVVLPKDYKKLTIKALQKKVNLEVPKMLIDEEVNARLSQVLERIEKLGLSLDGYLKSVGKTPETLRAEYEVQAQDAISTELILNEVANQEKIKITEKEIDEFIKTTGEDLDKVHKDQRDILKRVIMRRSALEKLAKE